MHEAWQKKLTKMHRALANWELEHAGLQTFSRAFECLIDNIMVKKAKQKGVANKITIAGRAREVSTKNQVDSHGNLKSQ